MRRLHGRWRCARVRHAATGPSPADGQMAFEKDDKRNKVTDWAQVSTMKFTDIAVNPALDEGRFVKPVAKNP